MKAVVAEVPGNKVIRKIRVKAVLFLVLALAAGGGAVVLVKRQLDRAGKLSSAAPVPTSPVVTAAMDIPIGTVLEKQHVKVTRWPTEELPVGTFAAVNSVLGRTTRQGVLQGEPLLAARLAEQGRGQGLTALLAPGNRAMAVKVDQVVGVAGFVQPGDFVDVITTMAPDEETRADLKENSAKRAKIILQNVKVLTVGEHLSTRGSRPVKVQVVTLEVSPEQSERLALAVGAGTVLLTMRPRVDQEIVATSGVSPADLLLPDEGSAEALAAAERDKKEATKSARAVRRHRTRSVRRVADKQAEATPRAPVVEVLRGDRIEERKLRPTATSLH